MMEYQIGEFSQMTRLSVKTLRFYQEEGLLKPARVDAMTGYRYYDESSADRARVVKELRDLGFSLKEIRDILSLCREDEDIIPFLRKRREQIETQIEEYRTLRGRIDEFLESQREIQVMNVDRNITIKEIPGMTVASIRYKGRYDEAGIRIGRLMKIAGRYASGGPFMLYHDAEYREDGADLEICVPVRKDVNEGEVTTRTLPGGRAATVIHQGPYTTLSDSYRKIFAYLKETGFAPAVPLREIYLKGPGMLFRGNPKKYLTEIQAFTA